MRFRFRKCPAVPHTHSGLSDQLQHSRMAMSTCGHYGRDIFAGGLPVKSVFVYLGCNIRKDPSNSVVHTWGAQFLQRTYILYWYWALGVGNREVHGQGLRFFKRGVSVFLLLCPGLASTQITYTFLSTFFRKSY